MPLLSNLLQVLQKTTVLVRNNTMKGKVYIFTLQIICLLKLDKTLQVSFHSNYNIITDCHTIVPSILGIIVWEHFIMSISYSNSQ